MTRLSNMSAAAASALSESMPAALNARLGERILKPNSKYLLRQTSAADNVAMTLVGVYYEV